MTLKDVATLAETTYNAYGDRENPTSTEIKCLFLQSTGHGHSNNADFVNSDAHAYLDIDNPAIKDKGYRIEGMFLAAYPFTPSSGDKSWYRITRVVVGQRKLLNNKVDNVHVFLRKVASP